MLGGIRGEVLAGPERRRRWSTEEKLRILGQSVAPGSSVSLVCRMHGISSGQLYTWRKQFRTGELTGFAPVVKLLWWDGQGLCLFAKRLERGRFVWPQAKEGSVSLTSAQVSMLLEGIDWRAPVRTWAPEAAC